MSKLSWVATMYNGGKVSATSLTTNSLTIMVQRSVHASPDIWFLSCTALCIKLRRLESKDLELAKLQAIQVISRILESAVESLAAEACTGNNELSVLDSCS